MFARKRVGILGAGNMGTALIRGFIQAALLAPHQILASRNDGARLQGLADAWGIHPSPDNTSLVLGSDIVILCTKPHMLEAAIGASRDAFRSVELVISVAAGTRLTTLEEALGGSVPVVRVMPNTPCLVGEGASAYCLGTHATEAHGALAAGLFGAVGQVFRVVEGDMDAVTALSGSGPAYVLYLLEALQKAGVASGLSGELSRQLATQTVRGAVCLAESSEETPGILRARVTSPGGTTEAGLAVLTDAGFLGMFQQAIAAAAARSVELAQSDPSATLDEG